VSDQARRKNLFRRVIGQITLRTAGLLALAIAIVPTALLVFFGVLYYRVFLSTLSAPGAPVIYRYDSPGGPITLRSDAYILNLREKTIELLNPRVVSPTEGELARIGKLHVGMMDGGFKVQAVRGSVLVDRLPSGKFSFEKYLPKRKDTKEEGPSILIEARDIDVRYRDLSLESPLKERVRINRANAGIAGDESTGSVSLTIDGMGNLPIEFTRSKAKDLWIDTELKNFEASRLMEHAKGWLSRDQWAAMRNPSAQYLQLSGLIHLYFQGSKSKEISADLGFRGTDVSLDKTVAEAFAEGHARYQNNRLDIDLKTRESNRSANFRGWLAFEPKLTIYGNFLAQTASEAATWTELKSLLPRDLRFNGARVQGVFKYANDKPEVSGKVSASNASWDRERVDQPSLNLYASNTELVLAGAKGRYAGAPIQASVQFDFQKQRIQGFAEAGRVNLAALTKRFKFDGINGSAKISAQFEGPLSKPKTKFVATAKGSYQQDAVGKIRIDKAVASGTIDGAGVRLSAFYAKGPDGNLLANGSISFKSQKLDLKVSAAGVGLERAYPDLKGTAWADASIKGTLKRPKIEGTAEAIDLKYEDQALPYALSRFSFDGKDLQISELQANAGSAVLTGKGKLNTKTQAIEGTFALKELNLADWGVTGMEGTIRANSINVSGTLKDPKAVASIAGEELYYEGDPIGKVFANATYQNKKLNVQSLSVDGPGTALTASGAYDFSAGAGTGVFQIDRLSAGLASHRFDLGLDGVLAGSGTAEFDEKGIRLAKITGKATDIAFHGEPVGDGPVMVAFDGKDWTFSGVLGTIERFVDLKGGRYNPETRAIDAKLTTYGFPVDEAYAYAKPYVKTDSKQLKDTLESLNGQIGIEAGVSGIVDDPHIDLMSLSLDKVTLDGKELGSLQAKGTREKGSWDLSQFEWKIGEGILSLTKAHVSESGDLDIEGELANFDPLWLSSTIPGFPVVQGQVDMPFLVGGNFDNPDARATLTTRALKWQKDAGGFQDLPLSLSLEDVHFDGVTLSLAGSYSYEDFSGKVDASIPLDALKSEQGSAKGIAKITIDDRSLGDFTELFPQIDPKRSAGTFGGFVTLTGRLDDYLIAGEMGLRAGKFATKDVETGLENIEVSVKLMDQKIRLDGQAKSTDGGDILLRTEATFPGLSELKNGFAEFLANSTVIGKVQVNQLQVLQNRTKRNEILAGAGSADIDISGNLLEPLVKGDIRVLPGADFVIPGEFGAGTAGSTPFIDPRFDINIIADSPARVRVSTADMLLVGGGTLTGSLQMPLLQGQMAVTRGTLKLPTHRVTLERGSRMSFVYRGDPDREAEARLDLDLYGTTSVAARRSGDSVERYDVSLTLRGNALEEGGLIAGAQSDPPDLSQDEILAMLGERELLTSVFGKSSLPSTSQIVNQVFDLALANFANTYLEGIAPTLGLDYLGLEYNPLEQTTVVAAKTLDKGLTLSARRQLFATNNQKLRYELKLTYRMPSRDPLFNRARFGVGIDQDRPWKITFDYTIRF